MKIEAEALRKIEKLEQLEQALNVAQCTEAEKAEICQFILKESALFQLLTPYIFWLNSFLELFSDKNTAVGMEEKIFQAMATNQQGFTRFFNTIFGFRQVFSVFVSIDLSKDARLRRSLEFA